MLGVLAHGAAGRAGFEINFVRRGPVNGVVRRQIIWEIPQTYSKELPIITLGERTIG
jgi:hypothetical protein